MDNKPKDVSHKDVLARMAEFIAGTEIANQSQKTTQPNLQTIFHEKAKQVDQHLKSISTDIRHLKEMMTRTGAQQLREESEKLSQQGKREAKLLEETYRQTRVAIAGQCDQLNKASMSTVKNVSQLVSSVRQNHLKKLTDEKTVELRESSENSLQKIGQLVASLQWKNLLTAILVTLLVATIVSLYLDNEWPWEAHSQIAKERETGKILLNSWQQLSHNDQERIIQSA